MRSAHQPNGAPWERPAGGVIAGVCAMIAERARVNPWLVRLIWLCAVPVFAIGLVAYLGVVIAIPRQVEAGHEGPTTIRERDPWRIGAAIAGLIVGFIAAVPVVMLTSAFARSSCWSAAGHAKIAQPTPRMPIVIVPMGEDPLPELEGVVDAVRELFPGLALSQGRRALSPAGAVGEHGRTYSGATLSALDQDDGRAAKEGGAPVTIVVAVVADDLSDGDHDHVFSDLDFVGSNAVVSVARLRSYDGGAVDGPVEDRTHGQLARQRLLKLVARSVAKLVAGPGQLCSDPKCLLSPADDIDAIDRKELSFCESHRHAMSDFMDAGGPTGSGLVKSPESD